MDGAPLPVPGSGQPDRPGLALTEVDFAHPTRPTRFQRAWGLDATSANAAVLRDARWSYVHFCEGPPSMLFDRRADPDERVDLAADPAAQRQMARMAAAMLSLRMRRGDRRLNAVSVGV
jgi:arylsulfatase A-like enzyme